jgi:quercetin dioxygenase-like cupin family protein
MSLHEVNKLPAKEIVPGFEARFLHTQHITIAYVHIRAGSVLPEHYHPHEQVTQVLEGQLEITVNGTTVIALPGKAVVIEGNKPHSAKALTDCRVMDVFCPVREDYKK